jgi:transposase-like protein
MSVNGILRKPCIAARARCGAVGALDAPSLTVQGPWRSRYRAVETHGQTRDLLLTAQRATEAALRLRTKASRRNGLPATITMDGRDAPAAALHRSHEADGPPIRIRQGQSVPHGVEQEHRAVKRGPRPMVGGTSCAAARDTLVGVARMHRIKKKQRALEAGDKGRRTAALFSSLALESPPRPGQLPLHDLLSTICDKTYVSGS